MFAQEVSNLHLRRSIGLTVIKILPALSFLHVRTMILRLAGLSIGHGTLVGGRLRVTGGATLHIGQNCWINVDCHIDTSAPVVVGDGAALGHDVLILTNTHHIGRSSRRAGALRDGPVSIGDGTWLGARSVVLPGVTIGAGAIIAAGAVVVDDVEENTVVGGVPAHFIRRLVDPT